MFPVRGQTKYSQYHHDYPAVDIFATCGTPVVAPFDGVVTEVTDRDVYNPKTSGGAEKGGLSFTLAAGPVRFYGSHLRAVQAKAGTTVKAGDPIGEVGETGNAKGTGCHLHAGLSPAVCGPADWWTRRGVISPYPYVKSWETGGQKDPRAELESWHRSHGCPAEPKN